VAYAEGVKPWRILILNEDSLFRELLVQHLARDSRFSVAGQARCACDGLRQCGQFKPDLVVLDLGMPRVSGVELAVLLAKASPASRIMAVAELNDAYTVNRVIECRLAGCVEKGQSLAVLDEAMAAVAGGGTYFSPKFMGAAAALASDPVAFPKILSAREQEVLAYVAEGFTSRSIGTRLGLSSRTVEAHRRNIMRKMDLNDMAGLMRFAIQHGFRQSNCSEPSASVACT
jgi:DNA-binding NarL/FixJ family response regulator